MTGGAHCALILRGCCAPLRLFLFDRYHARQRAQKVCLCDQTINPSGQKRNINVISVDVNIDVHFEQGVQGCGILRRKKFTVTRARYC